MYSDRLCVSTRLCIKILYEIKLWKRLKMRRKFFFSPPSARRQKKKELISLSFCASLDKTFYIHGSVHSDFILIRSNDIQQYAGVYLLLNYSTCFGCLSHPSSGLHPTVNAAPGTGHITCQSNNLPPAWLN